MNSGFAPQIILSIAPAIRVGIALGLALVTSIPVFAQVVLNEVMADNQRAVERGNDYPDYVELYNTSGQIIDLSGMSMSDNPAMPRLFVFPEGTSIPAFGYLLVWCDLEIDRPGLHTGFALGARGDALSLHTREGGIIDTITFGMQIADQPISRVPDGSGIWTLSAPTPLSPNEARPTASPASLRINEWMAKPATGDDWIELYNPQTEPVQLSGLIFTDKATVWPTNRPIPALTYVAPRGFVIFQPTALEKNDADHLDFKLGASGETITLFSADRATMIDRITFGAQVVNTSQGCVPDGSKHVITFPSGQQTPGSPNIMIMTNVVISEVLSHTDPPLEDAIELHNTSTNPVDIGGWYLSDDAVQPGKFQIPIGTTLPPLGYWVVYERTFGSGTDGFTLNSYEGDEVFLSAVDASGQLSGWQARAQFGALFNGVTAGRWVTSVGVDFVPLDHRTLGVDNPTSLPEFRKGTGLPNAGPRMGPVVINEIMFYPQNGSTGENVEDEYIELHNITSDPVHLYDPQAPTNGWRLANGVTMQFTKEHVLPPNGFLLLVNFDPLLAPETEKAFRSKFNVPKEVSILGPYGGRLSDLGETIVLERPDRAQGTNSSNAGFVPYMEVEHIQYSVKAPWPPGASGSGNSLQRLAGNLYANDPVHWTAATPTAGRPNVPDADGDWMPDAWETAHGLNPLSFGDAFEDPDGDSASNRDEYFAGTNPTDQSSVFRIALYRDNESWCIEVHSSPERNCGIQLREPTSDSWHTMVNLPAGTERPTVIRTNLPNAGVLLRLVIPATP